MGGTQFVGEAVARYFIEKGYSVSILTRGFLQTRYTGLAYHYFGNREYAKSINIPPKVRFDVIIDISAYTPKHIVSIFESVTVSPTTRYIMCSSGAVYLPSNRPLTESSPTGINSFWGNYGINKLLAEEALIRYGRKLGFNYTIFRPSYFYGPGNNLEREIQLFRKMSEQKEIKYPKSDSRVQFIYIDDFVKLIDSSIHSEAAKNNIYNATNPQEIGWDEWIATIAAVSSCTPKLSPQMQSSVLHAKEYFPFRDYTYLLSGRKVEQDGLLVPSTSLINGLKSTYDWFCQSENIRPESN